MNLDEQLLVSEAAELLNVDRSTIDYHVQRGHIRVVRVERTSGRGRRWLNGEDVRRLLKEKEGS